MHDLHAADQILKLVLEKAAQNKLSVVKKIVIDLGAVIEHGAEINPDNLVFNIKLLAKNTVAEKAAIVINKIGTDTWKLVEIEGE